MVSLDDVAREIGRLRVAVEALAADGSMGVAEWASAAQIHVRFGVNHMTLRVLVKGGEVRARKLADNDIIKSGRSGNVIYRVKDVDDWINQKCVQPSWAEKGGGGNGGGDDEQE